MIPTMVRIKFTSISSFRDVCKTNCKRLYPIHIKDFKFLSNLLKLYPYFFFPVTLTSINANSSFDVPGNCCIYNQHTCLCLWKKWNGGGCNGGTFWMYLVASFCDGIRDKVCFLHLVMLLGLDANLSFLNSTSFTIGLVPLN